MSVPLGLPRLDHKLISNADYYAGVGVLDSFAKFCKIIDTYLRPELKSRFGIDSLYSIIGFNDEDFLTIDQLMENIERIYHEISDQNLEASGFLDIMHSAGACAYSQDHLEIQSNNSYQGSIIGTELNIMEYIESTKHANRRVPGMLSRLSGGSLNGVEKSIDAVLVSKLETDFAGKLSRESRLSNFHVIPFGINEGHNEATRVLLSRDIEGLNEVMSDDENLLAIAGVTNPTMAAFLVANVGAEILGLILVDKNNPNVVKRKFALPVDSNDKKSVIKCIIDARKESKLMGYTEEELQTLIYIKRSKILSPEESTKQRIDSYNKFLEIKAVDWPAHIKALKLIVYRDIQDVFEDGQLNLDARHSLTALEDYLRMNAIKTLVRARFDEIKQKHI